MLTNSLCLLCGAAEGLDISVMLDILSVNGGDIPGIKIVPNTLSMNSFRFDALLKVDRDKYAKVILDEIDRDYLYMLRNGATSFWEDFDLSWTNNAFRIDEMPVAGKKDIHGDFGAYCYKGFRHSLCHGWSSGPAAFCIEHVLGIRPLDVGCKTIEVTPDLGDLEWAEGAMALPDGRKVAVRVESVADGTLRVTVEDSIVDPDGGTTYLFYMPSADTRIEVLFSKIPVTPGTAPVSVMV